MLVMSLSPLLGQAIPDIAETAEILVFPRRGARSGSSRVPKPQEEIHPLYPPRTSWRVLGGARGGLGARFWHTFGLACRPGCTFYRFFCQFSAKLRQISEIFCPRWVCKAFPASFFHDFLTI